MLARSRRTKHNKDSIESGGRDETWRSRCQLTTLRDWNGRAAWHNTRPTLANALALALDAEEAEEEEEEGSGQQTGSAEVILPRRALQGNEQGERASEQADKRSSDTGQPTAPARIPHDSIADAPKGLVFSWASLPYLPHTRTRTHAHTHTHTPHVRYLGRCRPTDWAGLPACRLGSHMPWASDKRQRLTDDCLTLKYSAA